MKQFLCSLVALAVLAAPMAQSHAVAGDRGGRDRGGADKSKDKGGADKSKDKGGADKSKDKGGSADKSKDKNDCKSRDGTPRECGVRPDRIDPIGGIIRGLFK